MNKFYIIGSINMDLIVNVHHFPFPGETILSKNYKEMLGGKGANQAVALARLGNEVTMFGIVGNDKWGKIYKKKFQKEKIIYKYLETKKTKTGIAIIEVEEKGENRMVVVPGANALVDKKFIDKALQIIARDKGETKTVLMQLEIPLPSIAYALNKLAKMSDVDVVLDPAPAHVLPSEFYKKVDYLIPNETEAGILSGIKIKNNSDRFRALKKLISYGCKNTIIKAGKLGAYYIEKQRLIKVPPLKRVEVVDATGAGDTFNASFAHAIRQKFPLIKAIEFANVSAGLSISKAGAQDAMPRLKEVKSMIGI